MNTISYPTISIRSEIGPLRTVLLHRPGKELETLTPQYLKELLFDDIPWVHRMQEEHDLFAESLRTRGCEVLYYSKLLEEILQESGVRRSITEKIIAGSSIPDDRLKNDVRVMLAERSEEELAAILIGGLRKKEIPHTEEEKRLSYYIKDDFPYYISPLPNLYFTRDPGAVIGEGLAVNSMKTTARARETLILDALREYHPRFTSVRRQTWYNPADIDCIEGGDILVLQTGVLAIGCSARTSSEGIEKLASRLFQSESGIRQILVMQIPNTRAYMHLDTVFTMVDRDKFVIFPGIEDCVKVYLLTPGRGEYLSIRPRDSLRETLKEVLGLSAVDLIQSGGGDRFTAAREQWNDSTNTLALAPGVVVTYKRNFYSNTTLREHGIEVVEIEGSELVRGRGGPRCMSMPLLREAL